MWQPLSRVRAKANRNKSRRFRWYKPESKHLEDRCLLSVVLIEKAPTAPLVGTPVVWSATATDDGSTPVYQFSVGQINGAYQVVQDFGPASSFTWNPLAQGTYEIQVIAKSSYTASVGETASASYTANSRIVGTSAVITPMANPLVALFSAPPSPGASMYVQFAPQGPSPSWTSTDPLPVIPGESTNFIVAGMLPDTTYLMRYVLTDGTASTPLTFTTGVLPANIQFPTVTEPVTPTASADMSQDMVLHAGLLDPAGVATTFATNLAGNIVWYYDSVTNNFPNYATSLAPNGTVYMLGGNGAGNGGYDTLRQVDLAGDILHQTNTNAVNAELAAMGYNSISDFDHEAQLLPNGDTAILALAPRTVNVNGVPTKYNGDMIIVLDQNFQVAWVWDSFQWLSTSRLPTLGEGPTDWLHANAISWSPEDDDFIVSLRAQDWVLKIDYANGTGDGHIVWTLGAGGNFTIISSDPDPWFSHQHDVRYINDDTIVLFDDGNTRVANDRNEPDSRGQELVLNEQTMTATLVVNADLGNYSAALGSAQILPDGNFAFTSGFQAGGFGQTIEVTPSGTKTFVQQITGLEYRSYLTSSLYLDPSSTPVNTQQQDATTRGTWLGEYGAQGYDVIGTTADLPSYATVTPAGQSTYIWTTNTTDPRGLQVPGGSRVAAVWYSPTSFTVNVNLSDGEEHDLELYFADWDNKGRAESVQITNALTGAVLSTQSISSFQSGLYLNYALSGDILITITRQAGANAVLNGLLFDTLLPPVVPTPPTASFTGVDSTTQGTWINTYGAQGYDVVGTTAVLPSHASVTPEGQSTYVWTTNTTDPRGLQVPGGSRVAAVWYSPTSFTVNVNLSDGEEHDLELYFADWDIKGRAESVQITNALTGAVLSTQSVSSFQSGLYLDYAVSGDILITIIRTAGENAVLNGLFIDTPPTTAASAGHDLTTHGTWIGTYGTQGYDLSDEAVSLPSYATVSLFGESTYTWTTAGSAQAALETPNSSGRVASAWYAATSFSIDVNMTDNQPHRIALYALDYDSMGRAETIQLSTPSGTLLDTESISSFTNGVYLQWVVTGNVVITVTRTAGPNAVVSGLLFDAGTATATAAFLKTDGSTQGNWIGTYGSQGYNIVNGPASDPGYATVTPEAESVYVYSTTSNQQQSLELPNSANRVAAVWYSSNTFTINVNLADGNTHAIALYALDYDHRGRAETITIQNAATGAVLDTRSISDFTGGVYLQWNVSGDVVITVTRTAGANAVVNGLFIDPAVSAMTAAAMAGIPAITGPSIAARSAESVVDLALPTLGTDGPLDTSIGDLAWEQTSTTHRDLKI